MVDAAPVKVGTVLELVAFAPGKPALAVVLSEDGTAIDPEG